MIKVKAPISEIGNCFVSFILLNLITFLDTLPRKTSLLQRLRRKHPKTVAEVGIQVDGTPQQQLEKLMTGVSTQILQLQELCAKQER